MTEAIVALLALIAAILLGNLVVSWLAWRQAADRDGDTVPGDIWERMTQKWPAAKKLDESVRAIRGRPRKDD